MKSLSTNYKMGDITCESIFLWKKQLTIDIACEPMISVVLMMIQKKEYEHDRDGYTNAKAEFVAKYTELAKKELKH